MPILTAAFNACISFSLHHTQNKPDVYKQLGVVQRKCSALFSTQDGAGVKEKTALKAKQCLFNHAEDDLHLGD